MENKNDKFLFEQETFCLSEKEIKEICNVDDLDLLDEYEAKRKIFEAMTKNSYLYKLFGRDPREWEIERIEYGSWGGIVKEDSIIDVDDYRDYGYDDDQIAKTKPSKKTTPRKTAQKKFNVVFKKRKKNMMPTPEAIQKMCEELEEPLEYITKMDKAMAFVYAKKGELNIPNKTPKILYDSSKLFIVPDSELHLGKLSSYFDSDDPYNYKKAIYRYQHNINEAIATQDIYRAENVIMTVGQDFYNIDNVFGQTSAGTSQMNDSRYQQLIITGQQMHIWAIDKMKEHASHITLVFQPGNHDALIDTALMASLKDHYRNDPQVTISTAPEDLRSVNVYIWNGYLYVMVHGKSPEGKPLSEKQFKEIVSQIKAKYGLQFKHIYILYGHLHVTSLKTEDGITYLRSGSNCGDGSWESANGYRSDKTGNAYLFENGRGLISMFNYTLNNKDLEKAVTVPSIKASTDYYDTINNTLYNSDAKIGEEKAKATIKELTKIRNNIKKIYQKKINAFLERRPILKNEDNIMESLLIEFGYYDEIAEINEHIQTLNELLDPKQIIKK